MASGQWPPADVKLGAACKGPFVSSSSRSGCGWTGTTSASPDFRFSCSIRHHPGLPPPRKTGTRPRSFSSCPGRPVHFRQGLEPLAPRAGRRTARWDLFLLPLGRPADAQNPVQWHSGTCSLRLFFGVKGCRGARGANADSGRSRDCSLARGSHCGSRPGEFSPARAAVAAETTHVSRGA